MNASDMERCINRSLAEYCLHHVAERAEREIPESDRSGMCGTQFLIGGTGVYGMAVFECDSSDRAARRLSVGAHHEYSDRLWSRTFFVGSTAEALARLRDPQTVDEFVRDVAELAAEAAEHYDPGTV